MYQHAGSATAAGVTGGLAMTGASIVWIALAGFAFLAAGMALARIAPRLGKRHG
jgi:hypothetical protein